MTRPPVQEWRAPRLCYVPRMQDVVEPTRPSISLGLRRGVARRCPNCGAGRLFRGYLKVEPVCPHCANPNGRYPADDGPAYFTILLIGHLVIAPGLALIVIRGLSPAVLLAIGLPVVASLTLALLPVVKGGWIGVLWGTAKTG